jgi:hypothetical protein
MAPLDGKRSPSTLAEKLGIVSVLFIFYLIVFWLVRGTRTKRRIRFYNIQGQSYCRICQEYNCFLTISTPSGLVQQLVKSITHTFNAQASQHTSTSVGKDFPRIRAPSQGISSPSQGNSHSSTAHIQSLCKDFESLSVGLAVYSLKEYVAQDQNLEQDTTINSPRPVRAQRLTCLDRWTEIEEARSQSRSLS